MWWVVVLFFWQMGLAPCNSAFMALFMLDQEHVLDLPGLARLGQRTGAAGATGTLAKRAVECSSSSY